MADKEHLRDDQGWLPTLLMVLICPAGEDHFLDSDAVTCKLMRQLGAAISNAFLLGMDSWPACVSYWGGRWRCYSGEPALLQPAFVSAAPFHPAILHVVPTAAATSYALAASGSCASTADVPQTCALAPGR